MPKVFLFGVCQADRARKRPTDQQLGTGHPELQWPAVAPLQQPRPNRCQPPLRSKVLRWNPRLQGVTAAVCRVSRRETYMPEFCCCDFRRNSVRQRMENAPDSAVGCVLSSQSCLPELLAVPHVAIASSRAAPGPVQIRKLVSCLAIPCFRKRSPCCCHTRASQYACSSSHDVKGIGTAFFESCYACAIRSRLAPISNGSSGEFNSRIRGIQSAAHGFRIYEDYRNRTLFCCEKLCPKPIEN